MFKLFAVGFSRETDELQLDELFSQHGLVKTLTIVRDQQTGISKGYAFVHMLDKAGADRAVQQLNGLQWSDRTLSVRYADAQQPAGSLPANGRRESNRKPDPDRRNRNKRPRRSGP